MPPNRRQGRMIVGFALIAALIASAAVIFLLDDLIRATRSRYTIVGVFAEAPRIRPGTEVWLAGRRVGRVTELVLRHPNADTAARFAATLELPTRVRTLVRRDSRLGLLQPRPLAQYVVDIEPGTAAAPVLRPGDTIRARPRIQVEALIARIEELRRSMDILIAQGGILEARIMERAPLVDRVVGDLSALGREVGALSRTVDDGPLGTFLDDPSWRASLERAGVTIAEIGRAARARAATVADQPLGPALERLASRADRLGEGIERLRSILEESDGFPGRWRRDPALREALAEVRAQLDSLVAETRRRPWRYF